MPNVSGVLIQKTEFNKRHVIISTISKHLLSLHLFNSNIMSSIISILFTIGFIYLIIWVIKAIIRSATNVPTWEGIIISALLGMLPLYLVLCYFGIIGERRDS